MLNRLQLTLKNQKGVSRLSIAIITVACFAVAGLLAYSTLSSEDETIPVFTTDDGGALDLRGNIFARCNTADQSVSEVVFTVRIPTDGTPVNLTPPPNNVVVVSYADAFQRVDDLPWRAEEYVAGDGDGMLEAGETFSITAMLDDALNPWLGPGSPFTIEVKTPNGESLTISRTTPDRLDAAMNLQ
ncbi:MAG: hypothetical protein FJZ95_02690 [Chloroflexi bacterium]|nr:hypothetical protein [Chloroflexota bacterium]